MIKRVVCRGFDIRYSTIKESLKTANFTSITRSKLGELICNRYYISDVLLLLAATIAVIQFSNQYYSYATIDIQNKSLITRKLGWMIFQILLAGSILFKYKKYQPKLFTNIKQEALHLLGLIWKKKPNQQEIE
jgi:hypothetical protein